MEPATTAPKAIAAPAIICDPLPAPNPHTLPAHHEPVHAPEVPLVLPRSPAPPTAATEKPAASNASTLKGLSAMRGKLKSAATKVIADQRVKRKPSALFQEVVKEHPSFAPVQKQYMTWLDVEKKLEEEYRSIQEKSFVMMMKAKVVVGDGSRAARSIGVNPFAENRVVLSKDEGDQDSDSTFINASYLDGGMRPNEYIAAAMPHNDTTRGDFWRMILQERTKMIAMLNDETEQHSQGYWPKEVNQPIQYGSVTVTLVDKKNLVHSSDCILRRLKVQDATRSAEVAHVQYKEWQDYGIPQEKEEFTKWMLEFDKLYEEMQGHDDVGPIVAHCFGGVGRTGTFLLIHATYQKIKRIGGKAMEIENILALMRHRRANMVQTAEQYKFCYRMLLELYEGRRSLVSVLSILRPRG